MEGSPSNLTVYTSLSISIQQSLSPLIAPYNHSYIKEVDLKGTAGEINSSEGTSLNGHAFSYQSGIDPHPIFPTLILSESQAPTALTLEALWI